ncbi:hypothetical protein J3458_004608 [Metarhizium acridum]|uniref:uncharacterized protein n=1 Tax=Metarhizium acridum TaxID=92637 RepID=UPI001C6D1432|nr:hypothetical protein J3458_004608 [Metarhizium acridum]
MAVKVVRILDKSSPTKGFSGARWWAKFSLFLGQEECTVHIYDESTRLRGEGFKCKQEVRPQTIQSNMDCVPVVRPLEPFVLGLWVFGPLEQHLSPHPIHS